MVSQLNLVVLGVHLDHKVELRIIKLYDLLIPREAIKDLGYPPQPASNQTISRYAELLETRRASY